MSAESEIRLMVIAMLFSPIILLGMIAACNAVFQRIQKVQLQATQHHPHEAWSMHLRG